MNDCKLIIVEGMPCSGKSTTAKHIAKELMSKGENVCLVDEGTGNHPADYEFQSYISKAVFGTFSDAERKVIVENSTPKNDGYVVELAKILDESVCKNFPELFNKLLSYKIYDFLDWKTESSLMIDKWREFAANADDNTIYVFNCVFLQNPMCETMMRFNFETEKSQTYISKILDIIKPLCPKIVYLKNDSIAESVNRTLSERGEEWINSVIDYHCNGGYGIANECKGFDGYVACLDERQKRELEILRNLGIDKIVIENPCQNWENAYQRIDDFIG